MIRVIILSFLCISIAVTSFGRRGGKKEISQGEMNFRKYRCNSCHGEKGIGIGDLRKAWQKYTDDQIKSYIKNPAAYNNFKMPVFGEIIDESDYPSLIEYIKKLGRDASIQPTGSK